MTKRTLVAHGPSHAVRSLQIGLKDSVAGEPGPVAVLFHTDCWAGTVAPHRKPRWYADPGLLTVPRPTVDAEAAELVNALIAQADVLLVVGSKPGATDTAFENPALIDPQRQRIIQWTSNRCTCLGPSLQRSGCSAMLER